MDARLKLMFFAVRFTITERPEGMGDGASVIPADVMSYLAVGMGVSCTLMLVFPLPELVHPARHERTIAKMTGPIIRG
jgi:hypothetical protein